MSHQLDRTTTIVSQGMIFYQSLVVVESKFAEYTYSDVCIYILILVLYDQEEREESIESGSLKRRYIM